MPAVTLTKKGSTTLRSQYGPSASTDLIFEVVHVKLAESGDWIECGGTTAQTQVVRQPVAAVFSSTNDIAAALVGEAQGVRAAVSGTRVVFTGGTGVELNAEFDVIIVGFGS